MHDCGRVCSDTSDDVARAAMGGLGLRSAARTSPLSGLVGQIASQFVQKTTPRSGHPHRGYDEQQPKHAVFEAAVEATPFQDSHLQVGANWLWMPPPREPEENEPGNFPHRVATRGFLTYGASAPRRALHDHVQLRTSRGPASKCLELEFPSQCVRQVLRRRSSSALFSCGVQLVRGLGCGKARREGGARMITNVGQGHGWRTLAMPEGWKLWQTDSSMFGRVQLAICDGFALPKCADIDGTALQEARRRKERAYPEW